MWHINYVRFFPNFSGKHPLLSKSQFYEQIPTVTALLPLAKHFGHCQISILQRARYVTYGSAIYVIPGDYTFLELRERRSAWHVTCDCLRWCFSHAFNGGDRDVYQVYIYRRLKGL